MPSSSALDAAPGFSIVSDHAEAEAVLRDWLTNTRLEWPGHFQINVRVGPDNPFANDDREIVRQPTCLIQTGPDSGTVRITWEFAPAIAIVHPTRAEADLWLSPDALGVVAGAERSFLLVMLVFLLRRIGWYHVHAAALIDPKGRGWLIAGNANCGKSTTTALMAGNGWQIGTDDIGFLAHRDGRVRLMSVRTRIALRPGGAALLGRTGGLHMETRNKDCHWVEDLGGVWTPVVTPEILAFPSIGERTSLARSNPRETLAAIVKWSPWVLYEEAFAQEHLDVLGQLARQSQCYDLTLGPDLFANPHLLQDLVP